MEPYYFVEFPKFKFSADKPEGVLVNTPDEEAALGDGFFNSPAEIPTDIPAIDKKKK